MQITGTTHPPAG
jgi:hypothetical protein